MFPDKIEFEEIRNQAFQLGWDDVGIAPAKIPDEDIEAYLRWLDLGHHGNLHYMENLLRCDPDKLFPGAKTAILFITHYKQEHVPFQEDNGVIASYARGRDYHHIHRKRLKHLIHWLEQRSSQTGIAKGFSDSTPLLEKALAVRAGLGWFGKNTLLIHRRFGTFTLLSGLLTTLEIHHPPTLGFGRIPRCGSCTRCLDACPTQAFVSPYHLDATKCLSYHLIESKVDLPDFIKEKNPGYAFGCDICQDVCPHNARKKETDVPEFSPERGIGAYMNSEKIIDLESHPEKLYGTPLQRRGVPGLKLNLESLKKKVELL